MVRSLRLPKNIDKSKVNASYINGVLHIDVSGQRETSSGTDETAALRVVAGPHCSLASVASLCACVSALLCCCRQVPKSEVKEQGQAINIA